MRPALWYLLFVGVPVVALLGVLRLGQGLTPPRAVHGLYAVTFDSSARGSCLAELTQGPATEITIAQSGPRLDLKLGELALIGTITGDSVRAGARGDAVRRGGCLTVDTIALTAIAQRRGNERELAGQLLFRCPNCSPVPFRAARIPERSRNRGLDA